jgi:hypothetical protein
MSINKAVPTNFELSIPDIPGGTTEETEQVLLQLIETVIPGMDITPIDTHWMGVVARRDSSVGIDFQSWSVTFFVDADFGNWKTLHNWVKYASEEQPLPEDHNINMFLSVKNNFGEEVIRLLFLNVWIKSLGEVRLSSQEGDTYIQCNATFEYSRYDVFASEEEIV